MQPHVLHGLELTLHCMVECASINMFPLPFSSAPRSCLQAMKAQSSYSSWYFIERATIGDIRLNCTIALSSQILNSGRRPSAEPKEKKNSLFGKAIGADRPPLATALWLRCSCSGTSGGPPQML